MNHLENLKSNTQSEKLAAAVDSNYVFKVKTLIAKDHYQSMIYANGLTILDAEKMFEIFKHHNSCSKENPIKIEICDGQGRVIDWEFFPNEFTKVG